MDNQAINDFRDSIKNLINPYNLTLTSDKDFISGADYESATVTATLTDKKTGLPVQDELLIYTIHDSDYNLLDDGILTTDVDGNASVVYTAVGAGDVYVTFSLRTVLQKRYVIEDLYYCHINQIDPERNMPLNLGVMNSNFILELDYYPVDYWEWCWIRWDNVNHGVWSSSNDKSNNFGIINLGFNKWIHITYKYENGTVTMTANNSQITVEVTDKELPFSLDLYSNRAGTHYKNLKLKKL